MPEIISDPTGLAQLCARLAGQGAVALDTEFLRERTYFAQLCLLQVGLADEVLCVDTLAIADLGALRASLSAAANAKVLHAARQDLEVLWPVTGRMGGLYDTQTAAALVGLPAQIGYADLVRELLGVTLPKAQTRTDWSQRPLTEAQVAYALDDVRYLLPLRERLTERLQELGRMAWFAEEMAELESIDTFTVDPEQAWRRLRGLTDLDPARTRLAQQLAAWRERRAARVDRPRNWILPDAALREIVLRVPRSMEQLAGISALPEGIRRGAGPRILAMINGSGLPRRLPEPRQRRRTSPAELDAVRKLARLTAQAGRELGVAPEILATRRQMEQLVAGAREGGPLSGWRRTVIGTRLLEVL